MTTLRWSGDSRAGGQPHLDAALLREQRGVDVGHRLVDDVLEDTLERGQLQHLHVVLGDLAVHLDVEADRDLARERGEDPAETLGERQARLDVLGDDAALDVHRVRHQLAGEGEPHRPGDGDTGLLLRLVGGRAEVRGGDDLVELEERGVGAGLLGVHVEAGTGDPALLEGGVQRLLVDDPAARGVDDPHRRLDLVQRLVADEAEGLGGLGQVDGDEVGDLEQLVEGQQLDAHLRGARGLHVGVVRDDLHAEGGHALGDQDADAAEADDTEGLLASSTPVYLLRFHSPFFSAVFACGMLRAVATSRPQASSAAVTMLEVGALTTITPALVAAETSTLSRPTPARATTFSFFAAAMASASTLVAERIRIASTSAMAGSSSARSAPLQCRISKSGPSASTVAGDSSSAMSTTGFELTWLVLTSPVLRTAVPTAAGGGGVLAAWKTHDAVGLTRM